MSLCHSCGWNWVEVFVFRSWICWRLPDLHHHDLPWCWANLYLRRPCHVMTRQLWNFPYACLGHGNFQRMKHLSEIASVSCNLSSLLTELFATALG